MGMFGAIWAAIAGGSIVKDKINGVIKDNKAIEKARKDIYFNKNDTRTYYDYKGKRRSLDTGEQVSYYIDPKTQDHLLTTVHGKVLRNLSEEYRNEKRVFAEKHYDKFHTVILFKEADSQRCGKCEFSEAIYKDIKTEQKYVVREFKEEYSKILKRTEKDIYYKAVLDKEVVEKLGKLVFYMDINNGHLVRLADSYLREIKRIKDKAEKTPNNEVNQALVKKYEYDFVHAKEFIEKFNKYQDIRKEGMDIKNDYLDFIDYYGGNRFHFDTETDKKAGY